MLNTCHECVGSGIHEDWDGVAQPCSRCDGHGHFYDGPHVGDRVRVMGQAGIVAQVHGDLALVRFYRFRAWFATRELEPNP